MNIVEFNSLDETSAAGVLAACLDIQTWIKGMVAARPFVDVASVLTAADALSARIQWPEVAAALARHPRIGEKPVGNSVEASWSAQEQAGVQVDEEAAFAAGNAAYENRFGYIFLICAAGLSGAQMLAQLRDRIGNNPEHEHDIVMGELRKIAALRLERLF